MVNKELLDEFILKVGKGTVLESGVPNKDLPTLEKNFTVASFNISSSRFAMIPNGFRSSGMIRLPYSDSTFDGFVSKYILDHVGDREYFLKEVFRVVTGPCYMTEPSVDCFPKEFLYDSDDMFVYMTSVNGSIHEINLSMSELFSRSDLRKFFKNPGSSLNKFNTLVPEDVKSEIGILFKKGAE